MILAIAQSIKNAVPDFNVYVNSTRQNAKLPALFVSVRETKAQKELSGIIKITAEININAVISNDAGFEEQYSLIFRILTETEYINYGGRLIRYTEKTAVPQKDGTVNMTAKIILRVKKEDIADIMENLSEKIFIKIPLGEE